MTKEGWNWLMNSPKWHFFGSDNRSLCGRYMIFGDNKDAEEYKESPDNCKACVKKFLARQAKEAKA